MKIAITGANGYLGSHIVDSLVKLGIDVIAIDLRFDNINPKAQRIRADIFKNDPNIYNNIKRPDIVLHLAWVDGFNHKSNSHINNLPSHYNFLKNLIEGGIKQIAVMGTVHEVGYHEGAVEENTPTNPTTLYGIAKNTLRQTLFSLATDNDVTIQWLRGFYIYGDDFQSNSIFGKISHAAESGKISFPFTSGKNQYDFIDIEHFAEHTSKVILQKEVAGIINICSGEPKSLASQVEQFIEKNNLTIKLVYGAFPERDYDSPKIWGNSDKLRQILKKNFIEDDKCL